MRKRAGNQPSFEFAVDLKPASTALFYAGESDLVATLKK
jgi:hypothetical protein